MKVVRGQVSDFYNVIEEVSEGSSGIVTKVLSKKNGNTYAIKSLYKSGLTCEGSDRMFFEFETVKRLDHPNVIRFYEIIEDRSRYHVVSEFYTGGELFERIVQLN
jgi:calcium-dependent protein kinase